MKEIADHKPTFLVAAIVVRLRTPADSVLHVEPKMDVALILTLLVQRLQKFRYSKFG